MNSIMYAFEVALNKAKMEKQKSFPFKSPNRSIFEEDMREIKKITKNIFFQRETQDYWITI